MSISITPKNSTTVATQTMSIDELFEERYKERQTRDSKIVEELRPLCEELPPDALDPVTFEPLDRSIVYRCGHALNLSTVVSIAKTQKLYKQDLIKCPSCNSSTTINMLYPYIPIEGCVEIFKKISGIFKKYAE